MILLFTQRERRSARGQKSAVIYDRSAMGICYLHSGSDATCKKCRSLQGLRSEILLFTQRQRRLARGQKSVVIYNRSAMGICYLHSGSDKTDKKCCNLHGIRDVVRQIPYLEAILRIYKSDHSYHYGGHYKKGRVWRGIGGSAQ